jgi:hypothetical protein
MALVAFKDKEHIKLKSKNKKIKTTGSKNKPVVFIYP